MLTAGLVLVGVLVVGVVVGVRQARYARRNENCLGPIWPPGEDEEPLPCREERVLTAHLVDGEECPNWPNHPCPYPKGQCSQMCIDSWDGENCFVREGEKWAWTGE